MFKFTLIPGDGIGPEVTRAALKVLESVGVDFEYEEVMAGEGALEKYGTHIPDEVMESIKRTHVALKGPITTPVGSGYRSINVEIRKRFNLYANLRPVKNLPGIESKYENVDLVIVRENTEDLYAGIEHMVGCDAAESIKIITRKASERVADFAFRYARDNGRKKVSAVHKANIMKLSDGLFLQCCRDISKKYPDIEFEDVIVDNFSMQVVRKPEKYDVVVTENLYGDILSDLCAGLVGGLGVVAGANIGDGYSMFEPVHGSAPKHAGKNEVNPGAMIIAASMMLKHNGMQEAGIRIEKALEEVLKEGKYLTYDLGGSASTMEMAEAICSKLGDDK